MSEVQLPPTRIEVLGEAQLVMEGEVAQLVTFLNKTLKDMDLIFGLSRKNGKYHWTIYQVIQEDV